jgi:hypothetical protein
MKILQDNLCFGGQNFAQRKRLIVIVQIVHLPMLSPYLYILIRFKAKLKWATTSLFCLKKKSFDA